MVPCAVLRRGAGRGYTGGPRFICLPFRSLDVPFDTGHRELKDQYLVLPVDE